MNCNELFSCRHWDRTACRQTADLDWLLWAASVATVRLQVPCLLATARQFTVSSKHGEKQAQYSAEFMATPTPQGWPRRGLQAGREWLPCSKRGPVSCVAPGRARSQFPIVCCCSV